MGQARSAIGYHPLPVAMDTTIPGGPAKPGRMRGRLSGCHPAYHCAARSCLLALLPSSCSHDTRFHSQANMAGAGLARATGIEPAASCSQSRRSSKLSYARMLPVFPGCQRSLPPSPPAQLPFAVSSHMSALTRTSVAGLLCGYPRPRSVLQGCGGQGRNRTASLPLCLGVCFRKHLLPICRRVVTPAAGIKEIGARPPAKGP